MGEGGREGGMKGGREGERERGRGSEDCDCDKVDANHAGDFRFCARTCFWDTATLEDKPLTLDDQPLLHPIALSTERSAGG